VMGRVCVKPCETGCNRTHIDTTVNIHAVERFIGDEAIKQKWPIQFVAYATHKRVLVIGGGPSGLSAAYHLTRMGHEVELYESGNHLGGLLWTGVPQYRLPKEMLEFEINRIVRAGVKIKPNYTVKDLLAENKEGKFEISNTAIQKLAKNYSSYRYFGAKGLILMAKNYYGLKDSYQATYVLDNVIENFTDYSDVVEEAKTELNRIKTEEAKTNSSITK